IAQMRQSLTAYQTMGARLARSDFLTLLAEACTGAGLIQQGFGLLDDALAWAYETGERNSEAELYRLKAELLLQTKSTNTEQVESWLRRAIQVARNQTAKSLELRATTSLARLLRDTNRRDEARAILTDVYNWFTEGFDTADLKDAKALLDELST